MPVTRDGRRRGVVRLAGVLAVLALVGAACGDDDDDDEATATTEEATGEVEEAAEAVEITGVDYAFEGVPETADVGTELTFTNESEDEAHELILFRIPDDETRSIEELVQLPEEESPFGPPAGVAVAGPGEDGMVVDGALKLDEPGRYALLCFIPVGADPEAVAGPPVEGGEEPGGPPHVTEGMFAELTVE